MKDCFWCLGWIAGFIAASRLFAGQYDAYAKDRDEYLAKSDLQEENSNAKG